ncbi:MAG: nitroreductase family protein [Acutalibacteraceae bacterium]|jgi:hypothetical protein
MTIYETMFTRRSHRRYDPRPLTDEELTAIRYELAAIDPIPGQTADFRFITPAQMGLEQAPHYLVANCAPTDAAYANVGYMLEKLDLVLQSRGLGSLWYGMKLPREKEANDCIVMQFGRPVAPGRTDESAFNRLPVEKIATANNPVTRAARLAPSAVNSQPWMIEWGDTVITVRYYGRGLMKGRLEPKLSKIDLGIVTRFLVTALEHEGRVVTAVTPTGGGKSFALEIAYK